VQQKLSILRSELQLANKRERTTIQLVAKATQMTEIAQERAAKATKRERKFWASFAKAKEIAARALEHER